jgi:thiamine biosynthesis lipoprotein
MSAESTHSLTRDPRLPLRTPVLTADSDHWVGRFVAMACPCEVLIESVPEHTARAILKAVAACAWRVEERFSRYRSNNLVHRINTSCGEPVTVGDEAANLLDFAAQLTELSDGAFDITSGVLRKLWTFDGGDRVPTQEQIEALRDLIGWGKVIWKRPVLQMRPHMQIDFGGIGKEYAVDSAVRTAHGLAPGVSCLVNFGGDIAVRTPRRDGKAWVVGIESCDRQGMATNTIALRSGAIASSGDSRRFVMKDGKRYSHVLDARTGWPVLDAPRSVTILADTCTQAGTFSTLAMLRGANAREFLQAQGVKYWLQCHSD